MFGLINDINKGIGKGNISHECECDNEESCCCTKGCKWFIQVLILVSFVYFIIALALYLQVNSTLEVYYVFVVAVILLIVTYIIFIVFGTCSRTCKDLKSLKGAKKVRDYMEVLFYRPGTLNFLAESYHYDVLHTGKTLTRKKVVTHTEFQTFPIKGWRDVSGCLNFDDESAAEAPISKIVKQNDHDNDNENDYKHDSKVANKSLVKLELHKSIELLNDGSKEEYDFFRDSIVYRLQYLDQCFNLIESSSIQGFEEKSILQLSDTLPNIVSLGCFISSIIFMYSEFFKLCFKNQICYQSFTIKKLISAVHNINLKENSTDYKDKVPSILLKGEFFKYDEIPKLKSIIPIYSLDTPVADRKTGPELPPKGSQKEKDNIIERSIKVDTLPIRGNFNHHHNHNHKKDYLETVNSNASCAQSPHNRLLGKNTIISNKTSTVYLDVDNVDINDKNSEVIKLNFNLEPDKIEVSSRTSKNNTKKPTIDN